MTFTPPDLSQILTNEQEFNTRLNNLRQLVKNELDDLNSSYSSDDSIKSLVGKINNPPAWIIESIWDGILHIPHLMPIRITGISSHCQKLQADRPPHGDYSIREISVQMIILIWWSMVEAWKTLTAEGFREWVSAMAFQLQALQ